MTRCTLVLLTALLVACGPADQADPDNSTSTPAQPDSAASLCALDPVPIADIQGPGFSSPMVGSEVTVRGVVTLSRPGAGLFIQNPYPFSGGNVSHGMYLSAPRIAENVSTGAQVAASGTVAELGERSDTLTSLVNIGRWEDCGPGSEPPVIDARLPLNPAEREAHEAMLVQLEQPMTVTYARNVADGEITVSAPGVLRAPTEVGLPGDEARELDARNRDWSLPVFSESLSRLDPYTLAHTGAVVNELAGVLGHDGRGLQLLATAEPVPVPRPAPRMPPAEPGDIRIAGFNVHEYFNGDGQGGGFPGERGARSEREFRRQSDRIAAAVGQIRPDVLAVMEVENDGFGSKSAIRELARSLSVAVGYPLVAANPRGDRVGTDVIAVGLLYRPDRLEPVGPARILEGGSFGPLNRAPLAQAFTEPASGQRFLVVSNHLKSKSSCPELGPDPGPDSRPDSDQRDGQACWNATRVEGATETILWSRQLAREIGTTHIILVGDFNAYRREDPVRAVQEEGFIDLVAEHNPGMPLYSFVYRGAAGTLDYAFASPSLAPLTSRALIWNINAAYPWSGRPSEPWLRSSDHDPVVVDLSFTQAATAD